MLRKMPRLVGTGNTPWQHLGLRSLSQGRLAAAGRNAIEVLVRAGVDLRSGCRLDRAIRVMERVSHHPELVRTDHYLAHVALGAFQTLWDAVLVTWTLDRYGHLIDTFPLERLKC